MKSNLYKSITKFSNINAIFWSALGLLLLLFPTSALGGAFYMIASYFTLLGATRLVDAIANKSKDKSSKTVGFIAGSLLMITGAVPLFCLRYVLPMAPLYAAAMLTAASMLSFILALCSPYGGARGLRIAISLFAGIASAVTVAFSFGFGIDGTSGFARIAGISAVLLGVYARIVYMRNKRPAALGTESEEK